MCDKINSFGTISAINLPHKLQRIIAVGYRFLVNKLLTYNVFYRFQFYIQRWCRRSTRSNQCIRVVVMST